MQIPLQISFHGIEHTDAMHDTIRKKAGKLDRYYDRIMSCRVVLELAGRHQRKGRQYAVRIDLKVPGGEIAVTHEHGQDLRSRCATRSTPRGAVSRTTHARSAAT